MFTWKVGNTLVGSFIGCQWNLQLLITFSNVAGGLSVPWVTESIPVRRELWRHPDFPGIDVLVEPTGGPFEYNFCASEHDIAPGRILVVRYMKPDGDRVMNAEARPYLLAKIGLWSGGDRHIWVKWVEPYATVDIMVKDNLGSFVAGIVTQAGSVYANDLYDGRPCGYRH